MNEKWFAKPDLRPRKGPRHSKLTVWKIVLTNQVALTTTCEAFVQMLMNEGRISVLVEEEQLTAVS